jgi:hypothetical protein
MAWGGKVGRMSVKVRNHFLRTSNRALPPRENPLGVPRWVMKALQRETLAGDQRAYNLRLQQLLALHELNKGGQA